MNYDHSLHWIWNCSYMPFVGVLRRDAEKRLISDPISGVEKK